MEPQFYQSWFDFLAEIVDLMEADPSSVRRVRVAVVARPTGRLPERAVELTASAELSAAAIVASGCKRRAIRLCQPFGSGYRPNLSEPFDKAYRAADDLRLRLRRLGLEPRPGIYQE